MANEEALFDYLLQLGDTTLVLGHRLSEWCGHGPFLEEDIAMTNLALDLVGQARALLAHAGEIEGKGRDEDALAFHRDAVEFKNLLLVEQPNGDFGVTMMRQFLFDAYHVPLMETLSASKHGHLAAIAARSLKEARYHLRHSRDWILRLGDGTDESHRRVQDAVDELWRFTGEMFVEDPGLAGLIEAGIAAEATALETPWRATVDDVFGQTGLVPPSETWMQDGGRDGKHTEHLGYVLTELQYLQRSYPGATW